MWLKNPVEANHNALDDRTKQNNKLYYDRKKQYPKHHAMKDHSWVWLTQLAGQHINNMWTIPLKGPPNIPVNSFPRNEKDCVFQSFTS